MACKAGKPERNFPVASRSGLAYWKSHHNIDLKVAQPYWPSPIAEPGCEMVM